MANTTTHTANHGAGRVAGRGLVAAALALSALACDRDSILDVTHPDIILPENITGPEALPTVHAAAIGDFTLAYSGSGAEGSGGIEGIVMTSGLLGDEWINSETFPTRIEVDRRNIKIDNGTFLNWFRTLSRARASADRAAKAYRDFSPDTTAEAGFPEVLALAGFTYVFFAENYCSGVPFSTVNPDGTFTYGPPLPTAQMYDSAMSKFNQALAAASALGTSVSASTKTARIDLARVGRARVLLDRGDLATAAAAVSTAPAVATTFVYNIFHSENTGRQNNGVFRANVVFERYSVADREAGVGLPYRSAADPRVRFTRTGGGTDVGFDRATPQFDQLRYFDRRASVPLATGLEARLIEAEERLQAGAIATYLAIHNALRDAPPSYILGNNAVIPPLTPALTDPGTASGRQDQHFQERAFWLWLTGHRLSDMRRLVRQYARPMSSVFPTGAYFKQGLQYDGSAVSFPVPFDEKNNPLSTECDNTVP
jgi:hypothetical protein